MVIVMVQQAYSSGLQRKEFHIVRKTRRLPVKGQVLVKEGDSVSIDTIIAKANIPGEAVVVNACAQIGVDAENIEDYILKNVGERIKRGEALAKFSYFFGLVKSECTSPSAGTIERISSASGQVVVREDPIPTDVNAYIPGTIEKCLPDEGAIIRCPAAYIQGIFGIGGETSGEIKILVKEPQEVLTQEMISTNCTGKVLIGGALVTREAIQKSIEVGAKAIVVGGVIAEDISKLLGQQIGVAITGNEKIGVTLIVTEGFGELPMANKTFNLLSKYEGMLTCVNGATQIRAGVIRPEIIIPRETSAIIGEEDDFSQRWLEIGTPIRLIEDPYFGILGTIASLPVKPQKVESGSYVRVLIANLDDGREVLVPRANVEVIEE